MMRIDSVQEMVFITLKTDPATRNSDRLLTLRIYGNYFDVSGATPFEDVILDADLPAFETIRRARQKIQANFPELKADADVETARMLLEEEFREYARS
jgi:hypothetical protein